MYNKKMEKQTQRTNKLQKTTIFLLLVFVANFLSAQSQQLKTYTDAKWDLKRTYTGYEDELGNITKHGTYKVERMSPHKGQQPLVGIYKFENGVLDGAASISLPNWVKGKLHFKKGKWMSIDYTEGVKGKTGYLKIKMSRNDEGLLTGNFEVISFGKDIYYGNDNLQIKGQFDSLGKATGWWSCNNKGYYEKKLYFEQGICLGNDENTIAIGRDYFINKTISEKELNDKGYSVVINKYYKKSYWDEGLDISKDLGRVLASISVEKIQTYFSELFYNVFYERDGIPNELIMNEKINWDSSFSNKILAGKPIFYMSEQLFQKIKKDIENGVYDNLPEYDGELDKFYVLKADKESRLYIPNESEDDFTAMMRKITGATEGNYIDLGLPSGTKWMSDNKGILFRADEAIKIFGSLIPKIEQWEELNDKCKWSWEGNGYTVVGPNGNSIFLQAPKDPMTGNKLLTYWSSTFEKDEVWAIVRRSYDNNGFKFKYNKITLLQVTFAQ